MKTQWYPTSEAGQKAKAIKEGGRILQAGGLVAFPTETVYGLGGHTFLPEALQKIYQVKGRPPDNPLIVHLASTEALFQVAADIPEEAWRLGEKFWPGPLTLVLQKRREVPDQVSCGLDTVAVRVPAHPLARELIEEVQAPLSAPSANLSGSPSPTRAEHVWEDLAGKIEGIIDGGDASIGVESTVLDLHQDPPVLLRPGGITREQLEEFRGKKIEVSGDARVPVSPGMKYRHYAPGAALYLFVGERQEMESWMKEALEEWRRGGAVVGVLCSEEHPLAKAQAQDPYALVEILGSRQEPYHLAASLYASLRSLDERGAEVILAEGFPEKGILFTLMNRLKKAAREVVSSS